MEAQLQFSEGKMVLYCQACFKALHMSFHPGRRLEAGLKVRTSYTFGSFPVVKSP